MRGTMMDFPLTLTHILERAGKYFSRVEIVSRRPDSSLHRYTYADFYRRARALAAALAKAGLTRGDRVATLMWNHSVHVEAYFGIPVAGGVIHTLNLRLHPSELAYIVNHAQDRFLIVDDVLLPVYESFRAQVKFERVIVVPFGGGQGAPHEYANYEDWLAQAPADFSYPEIEEDEGAAMCFTSGTTGKPKGVVNTHRALVLHSLAQAMPDCFDLAQRDVVLSIAPMFHVNGWGLTYTGVMVGAKLVLPGPRLDAVSLLELLQGEGVTRTAAVPTVWISVLEEPAQNPARWRLEPGLQSFVGGAALSESLLREMDRHGLGPIHAWGMTETTPIATLGRLLSHMDESGAEQRNAGRLKQGRPAPFVELRAVNAEGEVPWDGQTLGELHVRGPWVAESYFNLPEAADRWTPDGWFRTGDVVSIDADGFIKIADRSKDLVKSGGEWISSVDLENAIMGHPAVKEAAVIAVPHPKWQERPLAVVVLKDGAAVTPAELGEFLMNKHSFAKWQVPSAFVFQAEIPQTSVGKFLKSKLREQFANWKWES
jgi:fatty-acyl-CoA synthase